MSLVRMPNLSEFSRGTIFKRLFFFIPASKYAFLHISTKMNLNVCNVPWLKAFHLNINPMQLYNCTKTKRQWTVSVFLYPQLKASRCTYEYCNLNVFKDA